MDALRVRYIIVAQSAGDMLQRTEQTLQATERLDPSQEDISLWLGRMEKVASSVPGEGGEERSMLSANDREKVGDL